MVSRICAALPCTIPGCTGKFVMALQLRAAWDPVSTVCDLCSSGPCTQLKTYSWVSLWLPKISEHSPLQTLWGMVFLSVDPGNQLLPMSVALADPLQVPSPILWFPRAVLHCSHSLQSWCSVDWGKCSPHPWIDRNSALRLSLMHTCRTHICTFLYSALIMQHVSSWITFFVNISKTATTVGHWPMSVRHFKPIYVKITIIKLQSKLLCVAFFFSSSENLWILTPVSL